MIPLLLELGVKDAYVDRRRVLLRLSSEASYPGDLNSPHRELSLVEIVVSDTRRPPGYPGPRGLQRPPRFFAAPPPLAG